MRSGSFIAQQKEIFNFRNRFYQMKPIKDYINSNAYYHLIIWLLLIVPAGFSSIYMAKHSVSLYLLNLLWKNGLLLFVIYFNMIYLIPKYYKTKLYFEYSCLLALLIIAYIIVYLLSDIYLNRFLDNNERADRNWFLEILFSFFNVSRYIVISFLLHGLQEKFEQKKRLDETTLAKLNTEINYLRAQINPHFLFNTLNNLYGLALDKSDKTAEIILKLSKIMDYMLYESDEIKTLLKKDIENLENYISMERIRQGNDARINFEVEGEIMDQKIVPLILLPLIENAVKHGVNGIIKGAYLDAKLIAGIDRLQLSVNNNYKPKSDADGEARQGVGLINLKRRLDLFYPGRHELIIDDDSNIYAVTLKLNLK